MQLVKLAVKPGKFCLTRDQFIKGEVALEGLAEGPIGIAEIAIQTPLAVNQARQIQEQRDIENAVASEDVARAFDPTPSQGVNINMEMRLAEAATDGYEALGITLPSDEISMTVAPVQQVAVTDSCDNRTRSAGLKRLCCPILWSSLRMKRLQLIGRL